MCTENVYFEGLFHEVSSSAWSSSGRYTVKFHINAKGTGVGETSGATYQWNDAINDGFSIDLTEGAPLTGTFTQDWKLIGQGGAPNLIVKARFHFTVNANDEVTVVFDGFEGVCK